MEDLYFGDQDGKKVFYFHGVPGSPYEANIFHQAALDNGICLLALDRSMSLDTLSTEAYLQELCYRINQVAKGQKIRLLGFSIGACIALQVANLLGAQVEAIYLISPAAPLEIKKNTENMGVGRYTFFLAKKYPRIFSLSASYQSLLSRISSNVLLKLLFSGAKGKDSELIQIPESREWLIMVQKNCFKDGTINYRRDVNIYVTPWHQILSHIHADVYLWHGESDNWAPIAMSEYLNAHLSHVAAFKRLDGLSHYSCLIESTEDVMQVVGKT